MNIRKANKEDLSRISEIQIFNYRYNFYPIFKSDIYYFKILNVIDMINEYNNSDFLDNTYVYDDGVIKGFIYIKDKEIKKLFVEPVLQNQGIGSKLIEYAITSHNVNYLWALEKNTKAISFYQRYGFKTSNIKKLEEDTTEYLIYLERQ